MLEIEWEKDDEHVENQMRNKEDETAVLRIAQGKPLSILSSWDLTTSVTHEQLVYQIAKARTTSSSPNLSGTMGHVLTR